MSCKTYLKIIEKELDDYGRLRPETEQHVQECTDCRAYYRQLTQLNNALKASASHRLSEVELEQLIVSAENRFDHPDKIHSSTDTIYFPKATVHRWAWIAAAAAVIFIVAGLLMLPGPGSQKPSEIDLTALASLPSFERSLATAISLPEQSISAEMENLAGDARRASTFLVNLIPSSPFQSRQEPGTNESE